MMYGQIAFDNLEDPGCAYTGVYLIEKSQELPINWQLLSHSLDGIDT